MAITKHTCKVCGASMDSTICRQCGWVLMIFPGQVPDSIRKFEIDRIKVLQDLRKEKEKLVNSIQTANRSAESTNHKISQLQRELESFKQDTKEKNKQINALNKDNSELKNNISNLKSDKNKIESQIKQVNDKLNDAREKLSMEIKEHGKTKEKLEELILIHTKPVVIDKTKLLKGVVMIEDFRNDIRSMLPIYDGKNSYGTNSEQEMHHEIKFKIRGYHFKPIHFFITTSSHGLILEAYDGVSIQQNGMSIRGRAVYARQSDNFMVDDRVRINISPI